jgi:hypothetical protein
MTRAKDEYPCRMAGGCPAEEWVCENVTGGTLTGDLCATCPFEQYINKLAEYEDKESEESGK